MMFNQKVTSVITSVDQDIVIVQDLLDQTQSETLVSDNPTVHPAPNYDPATATYTLAQSTAVNGIYEGIYRIPSSDGCAELEIVSIISHIAPPSGAPARTRLCGQGTYTDQPSVSALTGKKVTAFAIHSGSPFEIKVKVTDGRTWCYEFDFTVSAQGFVAVIAGDGQTRGQYNGVWSGVYNRANAGNTETRMIRTLANPIMVTRVAMNYSCTAPLTQCETLNFAASFGNQPAGTYTVMADVNLSISNLRSDLYSLNGQHTQSINSLTLYGTGANPFGDDN